VRHPPIPIKCIKYMDNKLLITADREDNSVGLAGRLYIDGFSGFGEGWHNNSDVSEFCSKLLSLSESMESTAELLGTQSKTDGSEYLELFCIRAYPLDRSKLNGIIGVHIKLAEYPYTDCRPEEILMVSGELKVRNHHIAQFSKDLGSLMSGSLKEVCLNAGAHI
jgi:hypothetical protein